jgi:hypothetical protein
MYSATKAKTVYSNQSPKVNTNHRDGQAIFPISAITLITVHYLMESFAVTCMQSTVWHSNLKIHSLVQSITENTKV